jgi:trehalose 6-phosphate synthase
VLTIDTTQNFPRVVAALQSYDVLLVNPVIDGTNLVAKEGPALNDRDGVLVLSRNAGAADTMTDALMVNPFDVEQTVAALEQALDMPDDERRRRAEAMRSAASAGTPADWLAAQRQALEGAAGA